MTHLLDYRESFVGDIDETEDTFAEINRNLLHDFDTAETVRKVLKGATKTESREPVKVYLRVKPLTGKEIASGESQDCLKIENSHTVALHPPKTSFTFKHQSRNAVTGETVQRFTFSHVFGPETNQRQFFEETSLVVVKDFINGQNCLVFSYGITNAGKTYTILGNPEDLGILPRTINILFNSFKNQNYARTNLKPIMFCGVRKLSSLEEESEESKKKGLLSLNDASTYHQSISSSELSLQDSVQCSQEDIINLSSLLDVTSVDVDDQGPIKFCLWISFAEIYNEYVYDLLEPISTDGKRTVLRIGDDRKGNPYIKGLTEIHVNNAEEALKLLKIGRKNQKIASTKLNANSSRSHCIFTLKILRVVDTAKEPHVARVSRLSFVDLAGSERYDKTQNVGVRLKEACNINTSLMTLGKCVELLRHNQNHANNVKKVPFRDSKLTRLLAGFFCGKGKASMIVNVNQCASAFDETLHALKFSAIAKKVATVIHGPQLAPEISARPPMQAPPLAARSARSSVAWADGSSCTPAGGKARTKCEETFEKDNATAEVTFAACVDVQDYEKIIAVLKSQLMEERKSKALMEVQIREEVSHEMAEQLVEIERNYNERIAEEQRATEVLYEKRMDILVQSVKKAKKRPRLDRIEDDDDEWVSSALLHKEEVKNKEMSEQIEGLSEELREMKTKIERLNNEICFKDENIKSAEVKLFEMEELKGKEVELTETVNQRDAMIVTLDKELVKFKQQNETVLESLRKELASREQEIKALEKKRADEAAKISECDSFAERRVLELEQEITSLKNSNEDVVKTLKSDLAAREARVIALEREMAANLQEKDNVKESLEKKVKSLEDELAAREARVLALEQTLSESLQQNNDLKESLKQKVVAFEDDMARLSEDKRKAMKHNDEELSSLTEVMAKNEGLMARIDETSSLLKKKDVEIAQLSETIRSLETANEEECRGLRRELQNRDEQVEVLERTLKDSKIELEAKNSQLLAAKKVHGGARSLTPTKSNSLVKQLEKRLQESTAALEKKNAQLISKNTTITKLESSLKELRAELIEREGVAKQLRAKLDVANESSDKDSTISELQAQLKEQQVLLMNKTKEIEEVEENLKFVEGELSIMKEVQAEKSKLKEELDRMKEESEKWKFEVGKREDIEGNLRKQLDAQAELVKEHDIRVQEMRQLIKSKEDDLRTCKDLHNKEVAELHIANQELKEKFEKALCDLSSVQASVVERNEKLDYFENLSASLNEAKRGKETEITQLRKELRRLRDRNEHLNDKMGQKIAEGILKEEEKWESTRERMKVDLEEQDVVLAKMERDLASKEEGLSVLRSRIETLLHERENVEKLRREKEDLDDQSERFKIKIFELETEVEKLQQEVKKEAKKKDSATQALKDGLEIVKAKKLEYETKMSRAENDRMDMKKEFEMKIASLQREVERLKSTGGEMKARGKREEKTDPINGENENSSNDDADFVYEPVKVESFNLSVKERVEIDVTPITGSGLPSKREKKSRMLKRSSSDLTLKEIQQQIAAKPAKKTDNCSDNDFTPNSTTKLRKTRSSLVSGRSKKSKTNISMTPSPSTCSLFTLEEDSENKSPQTSQKAGTSGKRKFFNKLALPEGLKTARTANSPEAKPSKRKRKLFTKTDISAPFMESPLAQPQLEKTEIPSSTSRAQEVIMRRLRSRVVKAQR